MTARAGAIQAIAKALDACDFECTTNETVWFDAHKNAEYIFERLIADGFDIIKPGFVLASANALTPCPTCGHKP